jgi:hypothetical protein
MSCTEIAPLLEDLLGGEMPEDVEDSVREHLACCPGCHRAWEWMCLTRQAFQALPAEHPRGGFERRLAERLGIEIGPVEPARPAAALRPASWLLRSLAFAQLQPGLQWALAASLLATALGGGFYLKTPLPGVIDAAAVPAVSRTLAVTPESARQTPIAMPTMQVPPAPPKEPAAVRRAPERRAALAAVSIRRKAGPSRVSRPAALPSPAAPQPEGLADPMAGLDAPALLGYVRAQDLPSPLRCQMGGAWADCHLETACQTPGQCDATATQSATTTE